MPTDAAQLRVYKPGWRDDAVRALEQRHRDHIIQDLAHLEEYAAYLRRTVESDWAMVRASTFAGEIGKSADAILERLNTIRAIIETRDIYTAKDPDSD